MLPLILPFFYVVARAGRGKRKTRRGKTVDEQVEKKPYRLILEKRCVRTNIEWMCLNNSSLLLNHTHSEERAQLRSDNKSTTPSQVGLKVRNLITWQILTRHAV